MKPLVCIVGKKKSGKTTLITRLIAALKKKNYKVGCIKHDVHGFEMDKKGKDTFKMTESGADSVLISNENKLGFTKSLDRALSLDEISSNYFNDVDIILVEGYKSSDKKKIEIYRKEAHDARLCKDDEIIALVTDTNFSVPCPIFGLDDVKEIVEFIESTFGLKG